MMNQIILFLDAIKFHHSIFALPFAISSLLMVYGGVPETGVMIWVIVAMVSVRTLGMSTNRLIDRHIDARNPRTQNRPTANGKISATEMRIYTIVAAVIFIVSTLQLHPNAWYLMPIPILLMLIYPFLKRFTWLCHFGLGSIYFIVPSAVTISTTGDLTTWAILLGAAGMFWVTGFDILYAIADIGVDQDQKLKSIPSRFGIKRAILSTRYLHLCAIILLFLTGYNYNLGLIYYLGMVLVSILFIYENLIISEKDLSRLNLAFFSMNGMIAVVFGAFVALDVFL